MWGLSAEQARYQRTNRCPNGEFVIPQYRRPDGSAISPLTPFPWMDKAAIARCPRCGAEWRVFGDGAPPPPLGACTVIESGRIEEPYFDDDRVVENGSVGGSVTQKLTVGEQWTQTIEFGRERIQVIGGSAGFDFGNLVSIEAKAESTLRDTYSIQTSLQRSFSTEITVEVPPRTRRVLVLHYRRIFQTGTVRVPVGDETHVDLPFRVVLNLTLDWSQRDEPLLAS